MARGNIAKKEVEDKIKTTFGSDYILTDGSKIYVWANDGNEKVQIALSMTCPKNLVGGNNNPTELNFESLDTSPTVDKESSNFTIAEQETINDLIKKLGL